MLRNIRTFVGTRNRHIVNISEFVKTCQLAKLPNYNTGALHQSIRCVSYSSRLERHKQVFFSPLKTAGLCGRGVEIKFYLGNEKRKSLNQKRGKTP